MLDNVDRRIIGLLQEDGELSISNLADRLGMTAPPCWRRVKALKDKGVLKRQEGVRLLYKKAVLREEKKR